ncbi:hypothetical protein QCA50_007239 [Cerrena zonata]|uniref:DUF6534 domain-containing protein n=1 Tax=Cerrena zonata TaxID=2478898 RepID=A0AAW0GD36_9APHY
MSTHPPTHPSPEQWMGGLLVGATISLMLYGVVAMQTYLYMHNNHKDNRWLRIGVWIVLLAETIHTAFLIHMCFVYAIQGFGNFVTAGKILWSGSAIIYMELVVLVVAHIYYLRRTWIFSKGSFLVTGFLLFLLILRLGFGLFNGIMMYKTPTWSGYRDKRMIFVTVTCGNAFAVLLELSVTIITILQFRRYRTGYKKTDSVLRWLIVYTVHSCALTTIISMMLLFSYVFIQNSLLYTGFYAVRSKLYANTFLGLLNTRETRQDMLRTTSGLEFASRGNQSGPPGNTVQQFVRPIEIAQNSETFVLSESASGFASYASKTAEL